MKKLFFVLIIIFSLVGIGIAGAFFWYNNGNLQEKIVKKAIERIIDKQELTNNNLNTQTAFRDALGFYGEKTYLILFLNNTEIRPGGGFIGTYAVVKIDKGSPKIIQVDGTENLSVNHNKISAPKPISEFLALSHLEFRDSNWWPDFASSSQYALATYKLSNGVLADKIDAVIGFTPTVFEEILKLTGPFTYDGITFNSDNFTEKLEYEIEYNFKNKGIEFVNRKQIINGIMLEMTKKLMVDVFLHWSDYVKLSSTMLKQKQIMLYTNNTSTQYIIELKDMGGKIKSTIGDYLLWVDANLGSLKTDISLKKELSYSFKPEKDGKYLAIVKMKYIHNGIFDWRTTRYRTYVRLYLPLDSQFKQVSLKNMRGDKKVDQGVEFNKQWFGTFVSIEPQNVGELEWQFYLSKKIVDQIKKGEYNLIVQKQLGTIDNKLNLDLDFGKRLTFAHPSELKDELGNNKYSLQTDLTIDREFQIKINQ